MPHDLYVPANTKSSMARRYFAAQARGYADNSRRGLWRFLRSLETPAVMQLAAPHQGEQILDAGAGSGHYAQTLQSAGANVTALDIEPAMIESMRQRLNVRIIEGDLLTVSLDPIFDKIVVAGVLEFVADPVTAVRNLAKGLRPDGPRQITILVVSRSVTGVGYWLTRRTSGINIPLFTRAHLDALASRSTFRVQHAVRAGYNWVARLGP